MVPAHNIGSAAVMALGIIVSAIIPPGTSLYAQEGHQQVPRALSDRVTVVGCVQREADYRRLRDVGTGGVSSKGRGVGDEFVLIHAFTTKDARSTAAGIPVGTSGAPTPGEEYKLIGKNKEQVAPYVGKRVAILGAIKAGAVGAGTQLQELEVTAVREVIKTCVMLK